MIRKYYMQGYWVTDSGRVFKHNRELKQKLDSKYLTVALRLNGKQSKHFVHRLVAQCFLKRLWFNLVVDHKDKNTLNNQATNLRLVSPSENNFNRGLSKTNTSGVSGVCFCKAKQKWKASVGFNYKRYHLGYFDTKEGAIKARLKYNSYYKIRRLGLSNV